MLTSRLFFAFLFFPFAIFNTHGQEQENGYCPTQFDPAFEADRCGTNDELAKEAEVLRKELETINDKLRSSRAALIELVDLIDQQEKRVRELEVRSGLAGSENAAGNFGTMKTEVQNDSGNGNALQQYGMGHGKTLARFREAFYDHFKLLAAVRTDAEATCVHLMLDAKDGLSRYLVLGDSEGKLYFFSCLGDLLMEHYTGVDAPVTAMTSYLLRKNESMLITGHANGLLGMHNVIDKVNRQFPGEPAEYVIEEVSRGRHLLSNSSQSESTELQQGQFSITTLESTRVGGRRMIYAGDAQGDFKFVWDNGTVKAVHGKKNQTYAVRIDRTHIAAVHSEGISVMNSLSGRAVRSLDCEGMNGSRIQAATFDPIQSTRAYGVSTDWELLTIGVERSLMSCKVRFRQPVRLPPGQVTVQAIKGYVILSSNMGIAVYNTTMSARSGPRETIFEPHSTIAAAFGQQVLSVSVPLSASSKERLLAIGLGDRLVAMFESHLPTMKPPEFNMKLWNQPLFIGAMILVGVWQFMRHRPPAPREPPSFARQYGNYY